jgi:hypothetical protein
MFSLVLLPCLDHLSLHLWGKFLHIYFVNLIKVLLEFLKFGLSLTFTHSLFLSASGIVFCFLLLGLPLFVLLGLRRFLAAACSTAIRTMRFGSRGSALSPSGIMLRFLLLGLPLFFLDLREFLAAACLSAIRTVRREILIERICSGPSSEISLALFGPMQRLHLAWVPCSMLAVSCSGTRYVSCILLRLLQNSLVSAVQPPSAAKSCSGLPFQFLFPVLLP